LRSATSFTLCTSRRGSRRRDGAAIVATSLQCRSHGIGPLDRRCTAARLPIRATSILTRRSTAKEEVLARVNELMPVAKLTRTTDVFSASSEHCI